MWPDQVLISTGSWAHLAIGIFLIALIIFPCNAGVPKCIACSDRTHPRCGEGKGSVIDCPANSQGCLKLRACIADHCLFYRDCHDSENDDCLNTGGFEFHGKECFNEYGLSLNGIRGTATMVCINNARSHLENIFKKKYNISTESDIYGQLPPPADGHFIDLKIFVCQCTTELCNGAQSDNHEVPVITPLLFGILVRKAFS